MENLKEPQKAAVDTMTQIVDLKLKALRSDLRLMILASVALNQFLANVALPSALTATAIVAAIIAPAGKTILTFLTKS